MYQMAYCVIFPVMLYYWLCWNEVAATYSCWISSVCGYIDGSFQFMLPCNNISRNECQLAGGISLCTSVTYMSWILGSGIHLKIAWIQRVKYVRHCYWAAVEWNLCRGSALYVFSCMSSFRPGTFQSIISVKGGGLCMLNEYFTPQPYSTHNGASYIFLEPQCNVFNRLFWRPRVESFLRSK